MAWLSHRSNEVTRTKCFNECSEEWHQHKRMNDSVGSDVGDILPEPSVPWPTTTTRRDEDDGGGKTEEVGCCLPLLSSWPPRGFQG